jgi:hypothetical protein
MTAITQLFWRRPLTIKTKMMACRSLPGIELAVHFNWSIVWPAVIQELVSLLWT